MKCDCTQISDLSMCNLRELNIGAPIVKTPMYYLLFRIPIFFSNTDENGVYNQYFVCLSRDFTAHSTKGWSCRARSIYLTTLLLGRLGPLRVNQYLAHSDNYPSGVSGKKIMTIANISWSTSSNECCRSGGGRTRSLLITSQTRIKLSRRRRLINKNLDALFTCYLKLGYRLDAFFCPNHDL